MLYIYLYLLFDMNEILRKKGLYYVYLYMVGIYRICIYNIYIINGGQILKYMYMYILYDWHDVFV